MQESKRERKLRQREQEMARAEIGELRDRLSNAYAFFDRTTDPDVLEACVYEINALRSRYNTAFKHYRERFF